ncbi:MAG: hypothetical protein Q4F65_12065, partial [Propionibacteriaceae bacterium]|nr:hypothetical protein [Propionibacteriaceae bacterium]
RPEKFLRLDQGAATRINLVQDSTLVIIQVYGPDGAFDEVLGVVEKLREWLFDVDGAHPSVFGWEETQGPMEFPDPDLPEVIRWQFAGHLIFAP